MKLLHVDSSITGANSVSRQLTKQIVGEWLAANPQGEVEYLDLLTAAPSHLSADSLGFRLPADADLSDLQRDENILSEVLVSQFLAADVIVVGAPMYNFTIPSQLKAWIDRLAQAGRTFKYTSTGPVGLASGKTVIIASSRGGVYSTSDAGQAMEHQESFLKTIFGFFGITDVHIVRAEGVNMGDQAKATALASADLQIGKLCETAANQNNIGAAANQNNVEAAA